MIEVCLIKAVCSEKASTTSGVCGMKTLLQRFAADESGATALEYALILALACLAPVAAFAGGGEALAALIGQATSELAAAGNLGAMQILPPDAPGNLRP